MVAARRYTPYEDLVGAAAAQVGVRRGAAVDLLDRWSEMEPWPDAVALERLSVPYAFVSNCSTPLARIAAERSRLQPRFVLSAEDAGWFKPEPAIYRAACRKLGTTSEGTAFVAGSPFDAAGAQAAGMHAWLVLRRSDHRPPDATIATVTSLDEVVDAIVRDGSAPR
jgi:2-haloalkanoic acid dehalogenase type II